MSIGAKLRPLYSLEIAQSVILNSNLSKFNSRNTLEAIISTLGIGGRDAGKKAERILRKGFLKLRGKDFVETWKPSKPDCDVYGLSDFHGLDWYVKFQLISRARGEQRIVVFSFHQPKKPLKTQSGVVIFPM